MLSSPGDSPVGNDARTPARLRVSIDLTAGRITVAGELDRLTAHHLLDAVRTLGATTQLHWVLATERLQRCDTDGVRALGACYRFALRRGATMTIAGADAFLQQALARAKLDRHVGLEERPVQSHGDRRPVTRPEAPCARPATTRSGVAD